SFFQALRQRTMESVHGLFGDVERRLPQAEHLRQAVAVIVMFVGDQDGVEVLDVDFESREAGEGFAFAESGVNEESGALRLEKGNVPRAARRQNGAPQADRFSLLQLLPTWSNKERNDF